MTRASFFAALLVPFLPILPRRGKLKSLQGSGAGREFQDRFDRELQKFNSITQDEVICAWCKGTGKREYWDGFLGENYVGRCDSCVPGVAIGTVPRKVEEGIEILSSWVDPTSGDTIALVLLHPAAQDQKREMLVDTRQRSTAGGNLSTSSRS